jgi:hypothetical protein
MTNGEQSRSTVDSSEHPPRGVERDPGERNLKERVEVLPARFRGLRDGRRARA